MSTREEIQKELGELKSQIEKGHDQIDGYFFDLGEILYKSMGDTSLDALDSLSANGIAAEMDMPQTIAALKEIRKTENQMDEWKKKIEELEQIKLCPKCGHSVEDNDLFCPVCGERIMKEGASDDSSVCPQCGGPRKDDAAFCVQCGFRFGTTGSAPVSAGAAPHMEYGQPAKRFCYKCRAELDADAAFCYVCGAKQE